MSGKFGAKRKFTRKGRGKGALLQTGFEDSHFTKESTQDSSGDWIDSKVESVKDKRKLGLRRNKEIVETKKRLASREYKFVVGSADNPIGVFSDMDLQGIQSDDMKIGKKQYQNQSYGFYDESQDLTFQFIDIDRTTKTVDRVTKFLEIEGADGIIAVKEYNKNLDLLETNITTYQSGGGSLVQTSVAEFESSGITSDFVSPKMTLLENAIYNSTPNQSSQLARKYNRDDIRKLAQLMDVSQKRSTGKTVNNIRREIEDQKKEQQKEGVFVDKTGNFKIFDTNEYEYVFYNDRTTLNPVLLKTTQPKLHASLFKSNEEKKYKKEVAKILQINEKTFEIDRGSLLIN